MAKPDVTSRKDIEIIVNTFYEKVKLDTEIGFMFSHVDWDKHLPVMYDFWDNVMFHTGHYSGNPMAKHMMAHSGNPMNTGHFKHWLKLFSETLDGLYAGKNTELLKERAKNIAMIMQIKILGDPIS
ncbi:MAG: group III truncated hemoglobin [Saprospiraceae bacterium]|nr:group III truncated hemoglobin [Saprospiraceae bacterium]MBK8080384.1 group III truncated hemoglobin [Saprospiraceae bacterium]MBK8371268.1 group III truncated hemoglobin [Saprospiraceae bacterium]MBK8853869.1 group III truncated hemoglobin [Saprospiraceae bacterium]